MLKTFKSKLLVSYLLFSFAGILIILLSSFYIKQKDAIANFHNDTNLFHLLLVQDFKIVGDFFTYEASSSEFFQTHKSKYLERHDELQKLLKEKQNQILKSELVNKYRIKNHFENISSDLETYNFYLDKTIDLLIKRGFKDFGVEGKMRNYIHELEKFDEIEQTVVLSLRRHEKDYIIRNEQNYVNKLRNLSRQFRDTIVANPNIKSKQKSIILYNLDNYLTMFNQLVEIDRQLGMKNNSGLKEQLNKQIVSLENYIQIAIATIEHRKKAIFQELLVLYAFLIILLVMLCIILSIYLSDRITNRVSLLANSITTFVHSDFTDHSTIETKDTNDEIGRLILNYRIMKREIIALITNFKQKVEERTLELQNKKEQIEQQKEEIETQHEKLIDLHNLIEKQNKSLTEQNKHMLDSITYASKIQEAMLPDRSYFNELFAENFLLFKPRDIISGDFYWLRQITSAEQNLVFFAAVDCTGHGVPGALMSMLGIAFLNEIVIRKNILDPGLILDKLRDNIVALLQHAKNRSKASDGMDVALCMIDYKKMKMYYSGANRPAYLIRNCNAHATVQRSSNPNELIIIKGDRMPIGKHIATTYKSFTTHEYNLKNGDAVVLFSDGYTDQFGGDNGRKLKNHSFQKLLLENISKPLAEVEDLLHNSLETWKGENKQTDDVLVVGVRV